jgi:predicted alpha/beta-fold hydrolase
MPLIESSTYRAPPLLRNGHLQTVFPVLFRKFDDVHYSRTQIETPDGDFFDLDVSGDSSSGQLALIVHGLEGSSRTHYSQGMVRAFTQNGWAAAVLNLRGCSGPPNRLYQSYHSGFTEDLDQSIKWIKQSGRYTKIVLIGFSLGGNIVLKYLGDRATTIDPILAGAAAVSVPCDLASSAERLAAKENWIYQKRFMISLRSKLVQKQLRGDQTNISPFPPKLKTFYDFDSLYTAPAHGFKSADDYWTRCSCRSVLSSISLPSLLLNARDDPFLSPACFPSEIAAKSSYLFSEFPKNGGHVGFDAFNSHKRYWHEDRILSFFSEKLPKI